MKTRFVASVLFLLLIPEIVHGQDACTLTSWIAQQPARTTRTPEIFPPVLRDTVLTVNGVSHKISIPAGFTMTVFAQVPTCRGLACSPDGVIYATSFNGSIYALPDHEHRGTPDSAIIVTTGLVDPHGIGFYHGDLYASNNGALVHFITGATSRVATKKDTISLLPADPKQSGHHTRNFAIDTVKKKFYVQVGSEGNMDTTDLIHRAQMVEMNVDGTGYRTVATGLRNAVGLDLDPRTGALWANNNGMDDIFGSGTVKTANNPSECVYLICDGANYGWPWCYGLQIRNPVSPWVNLDTNIVKTFSGPVAEVLAHEAPLGLHFYRGSAFPSIYRNAIFQCYHGSWDRTPPAPPRITVMWADSDGHNARVTDFVNGFQPDSSGTRWGRVVSVIEGADSALYVSDDAAGQIYRIRYTGVLNEAVQQRASLFTIGDPLPNPTRAGVSLPITLATSTIVNAEVFDALGRLILSTEATPMEAGRHTIPFDLTALPDADYIVRIHVGSEVISKRVVLSR